MKKKKETLWIIKNVVKILLKNAKIYKPQEELEIQYTPPRYLKKQGIGLKIMALILAPKKLVIIVKNLTMK